MEYEKFETEFFTKLHSLSKKCISMLDAQSDLIKTNLGEEGSPKNIDKFINQFNQCLLDKEKKFELFEGILTNPNMGMVLDGFRKSDVLIRVCTSSKAKENKKLLKWLLSMDLDYHTQDEDGKTALMYAAQELSLLPVVKHILEHCRPAIHILDKNGENVLFHSAKNVSCFSELLKTEIDINHKNYRGENILLYCCKNKIFEPIKTLMTRNDIDVNEIDNNERTAAMYLAENARSVELRLLSQRNCNFNYRNKKNESVLSILIPKLYQSLETRKSDSIFITTKSYFSTLSALISLKCNFNIPIDSSENTALMAFIIVGDYSTAIDVLNSNAIYDLSVKNKFGESASSICLKSMKFPVLYKSMLENPTFDFEYVDPQTGNTMLMLSVVSKNVYTSTILENNVNSINDVNHKQENALILAVKSDNQSVVDLLLNHGIFVNQQDVLGNTALHYAVMVKNTFFIEKLLAHHADVHLKNGEGQSPLDLARNFKDTRIVQQLLGEPIKGKSSVTSSDEEKENERIRSVIEIFKQQMKEYLYLCISTSLNELDENKSLSIDKYYRDQEKLKNGELKGGPYNLVFGMAMLPLL